MRRGGKEKEESEGEEKGDGKGVGTEGGNMRH